MGPFTTRLPRGLHCAQALRDDKMGVIANDLNLERPVRKEAISQIGSHKHKFSDYEEGTHFTRFIKITFPLKNFVDNPTLYLINRSLQTKFNPLPAFFNDTNSSDDFFFGRLTS